MKVLIGSRALHYWVPEINLSEHTDWDVISYGPIDGFEWHDPNLLNNYEMALKYTTPFTIKYKGHILNVMSMEGLAIIKRSHLWRDHKFQSHITQYHRFGLKNAFTINECIFNPLYIDRLKETHEYFPHNHPKLNKSKDAFFSDAVTRVYDHDLIHELVAFYDRPIYTKLQPENTDSVWCDKNRWDDLSFIDKLLCINEECMVTAIERFLVPNPQFPAKLGFMKSLDKVCTTMCSGWFRDFAIDNYPLIFNSYNEQHMIKALNKLKEQ